MRLLTYRINIKKNKFDFISDLYWGPLFRDKLWHYFFDLEGITLRFTPKNDGRVVKFLEKQKGGYKFTFKRRTYYDPTRNEYNPVKFVGEELALMFHQMSVLLTKYPPRASFQPTLERLNHGLVNMLGVHDFVKEAYIYLDLAEGRLDIIGRSLPLPKWVYKLYYNLCKIYRNWLRKR